MNKIFSGVEKIAVVVIVLMTLVNFFLGQTQIAYGILIGGLLFTADYMGIRFIIISLTEKKYSLGFSIFLLLIKLLILALMILILFLFAKVNIYGFIIGLTAVVIIIIGKGIKGNNDGTL